MSCFKYSPGALPLTTHFLQLILLDAAKIEESTDCISAYDDDLKILIWNKACEQKYGISKEKALHRNLLHLFPHIEQDYRVQCLRKCGQEQESFFFSNLPLLYSTGFYSQAILPLHTSDETVIGSLNIVRDGEHERIRKEDLVQPLYCQQGIQAAMRADRLLKCFKDRGGLNPSRSLCRLFIDRPYSSSTA